MAVYHTMKQEMWGRADIRPSTTRIYDFRRTHTMNKPVLVIMAAGMGSRYGGLKQIDPVDKEGHIIMDFSIYGARRAGFE